MQIKQVTIRGFHNVTEATYLFDKSNYVYGPNGAGKSTILQAIQLGLLGYIPGTAKTNAGIMSHSEGRELDITVILEDNDNVVTVHRNYKREGATKVVDKFDISPESYSLDSIVGNLDLPILNFTEFLGLSANKQKDLLISILPSFEDAVDVEDYLKDDDAYSSDIASFVHDLVVDCPAFAGVFRPTFNNVEVIKQFNDYLKEVKSTLDADSKRISATTQSLIYYDDYSGEVDVSILQTDIDRVLQQRDEALKIETQLANYESQRERLKEYDKYTADSVESDVEYLKLQAELDSLRGQLWDLNTESDRITSRISEIKASIAQNNRVIESRGICPFIEYNCESIEDKIPALEAENAKLVDELNELTARLQDDIKETKFCIDGDIKAIEKKQADLGMAYKVRDNLKASMVDVPLGPPAVSSQELTVQLQQLNDDLVKASANAKYNELLEVIQKEKLKLTPQIEFVKSAIKRTGANGLQSQLMLKPFRDLSDNMYQLISELNLTELGTPQFSVEEKANSFKFGLLRANGKSFIPFQLLSSGEKCVFTLIFMSAIAANTDSDLKFVLIDDLFDHLDDARFETVIKNIDKLSDKLQFIFAGVKKLSVDNVNSILVGGRDD